MTEFEQNIVKQVIDTLTNYKRSSCKVCGAELSLSATGPHSLIFNCSTITSEKYLSSNKNEKSEAQRHYDGSRMEFSSLEECNAHYANVNILKALELLTLWYETPEEVEVK